jgi:hypothetical protein
MNGAVAALARVTVASDEARASAPRQAGLPLCLREQE